MAEDISKYVSILNAAKKSLQSTMTPNNKAAGADVTPSVALAAQAAEGVLASRNSRYDTPSVPNLSMMRAENVTGSPLGSAVMEGASYEEESGEHVQRMMKKVEEVRLASKRRLGGIQRQLEELKQRNSELEEALHECRGDVVAKMHEIAKHEQLEAALRAEIAETKRKEDMGAVTFQQMSELEAFLRTQIDNLEQQNQELHQQMIDKLQNAHDEKVALEERIAELSRRKKEQEAHLEDKLAESIEARKNIEENYRAMADSMEMLKEHSQRQKDDVKQLKDAEEQLMKESQTVKNLKQAAEAFQESIEEQSNEIEKLQKKLNEARAEAQQIKHEHDEAKFGNEKNERKVAKLTNELEVAENEMSELRKEVRKAKEAKIEAEDQLEEQTKISAKLNQRLDDEKSAAEVAAKRLHDQIAKLEQNKQALEAEITLEGEKAYQAQDALRREQKARADDISQLERSHATEMRDADRRYALDLNDLKSEHDRHVQELEDKFKKEQEAVKETHKTEIDDLNAQHETKIADLEMEHMKNVHKLNREHEKKRHEAERAIIGKLKDALRKLSETLRRYSTPSLSQMEPPEMIQGDELSVDQWVNKLGQQVGATIDMVQAAAVRENEKEGTIRALEAELEQLENQFKELKGYTFEILGDGVPSSHPKTDADFLLKTRAHFLSDLAEFLGSIKKEHAAYGTEWSALLLDRMRAIMFHNLTPAERHHHGVVANEANISEEQSQLTHQAIENILTPPAFHALKDRPSSHASPSRPALKYKPPLAGGPRSSSVPRLEQREAQQAHLVRSRSRSKNLTPPPHLNQD